MKKIILLLMFIYLNGYSSERKGVVGQVFDITVRYEGVGDYESFKYAQKYVKETVNDDIFSIILINDPLLTRRNTHSFTRPPFQLPSCYEEVHKELPLYLQHYNLANEREANIQANNQLYQRIFLCNILKKEKIPLDKEKKEIGLGPYRYYIEEMMENLKYNNRQALIEKFPNYCFSKFKNNHEYRLHILAKEFDNWKELQEKNEKLTTIGIEEAKTLAHRISQDPKLKALSNQFTESEIRSIENFEKYKKIIEPIFDSNQ